MTEDQRRLLADLADVRERGSHALACDGRPRQTAHELTSLGYAKWAGSGFGSQFWQITDAGMKVHENAA